MGVLDANPKEWRSVIKINPYCAPSPMDQTCLELIIVGKVIDLANVSSKLVYNEFRQLLKVHKVYFLTGMFYFLQDSAWCFCFTKVARAGFRYLQS